MAITGYFLPSAPGADRRQDSRRKLSLLARGAQHDGTGIAVRIHNISGTGLLLESDVKLAAGDRIEIELPHAGDITAVVIWASGRHFGCQFEGPVSPATLSAVELKSAIEPPAGLEESEEEDQAEPLEAEAAPVIDEAFGDRLQRLRTAAGLNQAELARRMGVSAPSVSGWEQGRAHPKPNRMAALAAILGVPTAQLAGDGAPEDSSPEAVQDLIDRSREQIARAVGISPDRVRIFVEY